MVRNVHSPMHKSIQIVDNIGFVTLKCTPVCYGYNGMEKHRLRQIPSILDVNVGIGRNIHTEEAISDIRNE